MATRTNLLAGSLIIVVAAIASVPAADISPERAEQFQALLKALENAPEPATVAAAYARANTIDSKSPALHRAYTRRMLQFGLPQIAYYGARALVEIDPSDGLAWGVVGYVEGRRGDLPRAFSATVRALTDQQDNPGILNNAGQLAAWFDSLPSTPEVSAEARRALANRRETLMKTRAFATAYERMKRAYQGLDEQMGQLDDRANAAREALGKLRREALDLDLQLRTINDEIDARNEVVDDLRRELLYTYVYRRGRVTRRPYRYYRRSEIRDMIARERQELDALKEAAVMLRRRGEVVLSELRRRRGDIEALGTRRDEMAEGLDRSFRWDPPAVDGVITPRRKNFPLGPVKLVDIPADPKREAADRLKLAKLYLENRMYEKALSILDEILREYDQTPAAQQARKMLDAMRNAAVQEEALPGQ